MFILFNLLFYLFHSQNYALRCDPVLLFRISHWLLAKQFPVTSSILFLDHPFLQFLVLRPLIVVILPSPIFSFEVFTSANYLLQGSLFRFVYCLKIFMFQIKISKKWSPPTFPRQRTLTSIIKRILLLVGDVIVDYVALPLLQKVFLPTALLIFVSSSKSLNINTYSAMSFLLCIWLTFTFVRFLPL